MPEERPSQIETQIHNLPAALNPLKARDNWVLWKWERGRNPNSGASAKWTKVPYQPSGTKASSTDRSTWSSYAQVMEVIGDFSGIGYVIDDEMAAFDVDKCRNRENGQIHPWARGLVENAQSYAEVTISGTGLRIIGYGQGARMHKKQNVGQGVSCESYRGQAGRYIVMTGVVTFDAPLVNIDAIMDATVNELEQIRASTERSELPPNEDDELKATIRDGIGNGTHDQDGEGRRSGVVWWVIHEMIRRGYSQEGILKVILNRGYGISAHIYDQGRPYEYAEKQLVHASKILKFGIDNRSKPVPTMSNGHIAVWKLGYVFSYDEFGDRMIIQETRALREEDRKPRSVSDNDTIAILSDMERNWKLKLNKFAVGDLISRRCDLNRFHPVKDYFSGLIWDGIKRIDTWLIRYCHAEDTEYVRAVGEIFFVAAVRRIMHPGCKFDEMLVLESPQGMEKSTLLKILAIRQEWFSDDLPLHLQGKEVIEHLRSRLIVEAAELQGIRKANVEHLKAFLSRQVDRGRMAYAHHVSEVPRQCVIVGTTNGGGYLSDSTGNRRFWPVKVHSINISSLIEDRDQLWAEAVAREKTNFQIRLPQRLWPQAEIEQDMRTTPDPYTEVLENKFNGHEGKVVSLDLWKLFGMAAGHRTHDQGRRLSAAMIQIGWNGPVKISAKGGKKEYGFTKGPRPWRLLEVNEDRMNNDFIVEEAGTEGDDG
jgi:predicted P-loop ATPase